MFPAILGIWEFENRPDLKWFLLRGTRKLFSKRMMYTGPIYPSFKAIMRIPGFKIMPDVFQLLQRCLDRHMFFNKTPKNINIDKLDIFSVDCMANTSLNQFDSIMANWLIRDNPAAIDFLVRTSNGINVRLAKTLSDLIFYVSSILRLTRDGYRLYNKSQVFTVVQLVKAPTHNVLAELGGTMILVDTLKLHGL